MALPKILLQLDTDDHASVFDAVVAVDAGIESLLQYARVSADNVTPLVHGVMFTRGGDALRNSAIFLGGSDVSAAESLLSSIQSAFFGPVRVSVMLDANGCNTTAAAAVLSSARHIELDGATATVLAGTGPVGMRVARLLSGEGCRVRLASRSGRRAEEAAAKITSAATGDRITGVETSGGPSVGKAIEGCQLVFACGAAGVQLLDAQTLATASDLRVAVDLNAVPPEGIESIKPPDAGREVNGCHLYGAIGVGGLKMKIHRASLRRLYDRNDQVLDAEEIYRIGKEISAS